VRIGSLGLKNLVTRSALAPKELAGVPIFVNLPSGYHGAALAKQRAARKASGEDDDASEQRAPSFDDLKPWYEEGIVPKIAAALDIPGASSRRVFFEDESGVASAMNAARAELENRASRCIVGGIDSLVDRYWLEACDSLGLLKTPLRSVGFMPGEAAAFLLLEPAALARRRGATILATVDSIAGTRESNERISDKPPTGIALAEAILQAKAGARGKCGTIYCDINGDPVRAADWGNAQVRIRGEIADSIAVVPAMSFGATRAAAGFVAACMAARAFEAGQMKSESALVWVAADAGGRASFALSRAAER
jgi:3-oxoacyl-[acyl-carrier-protein] synthase-1